MELTAKQQTIELIKGSNNIVLFTHISPDGDALGSVVALRKALQKLAKKTTVVCADKIPTSFNFLADLNYIENQFKATKEFVISLNVSETKGDYQLGYKVDDVENKLNIFVSPSSGNFRASDASFRAGGFQYDLIVILDTPNITRIGPVYDQNKDFFHEIPVINIDHHSSNNHFGKINWVDPSATSVCEIMVAMLESLGREQSLFDSEIATALLTGIITDTGSFQNSNTTPKSLTVAAQLLAIGADRDKIIKSVFKTHPISTIRLWGRILSNIKIEEQEKFAWSFINQGDLLTSDAKEEEISGAMDEFLKTISGIDFVLLISERKNLAGEKTAHVSLRSIKKDVNVARLANIFGGGGHDLAAGFDIKTENFEKIKSEIIEKIKSWVANK